MTCQHFAREGLARVERGLPDPHVDDCADCQAARADYERVRAAVAASGAGFTPRAGWEARIEAALDREARPAPPRRGWWLAGGLAVAAAAVLLWWQLGRTPPGPAAPAVAVAQIEIVRGDQVVRARTPAVGDTLRVSYPAAGAAIWIYRGEALAHACAAARCELRALAAATYHVVTARTALPAPASFDEATAALARAGTPYDHRELIVE